MTYRIGVDIGGTFTDFALIDDDNGSVHTHKQLTTPDDPAASVLSGISAILRRTGCGIEQVSAVVHGTTLVTNAVIERKGAQVGMLVTEGFGDILEMRKERRYDLYDLALEFPEPLVPRTLRREVKERMRYDGAVIAELDLDAALAMATQLVEVHQVEAIAVCLLHSYANPAHEQRLGEAIARRFPHLSISLSSDGFPIIREYERWTTATMNAYVQPMVDRYLRALESGLGALGFRGNILIVSSSGGALTPETARRFPVRLLESGPAAGALMSAEVGRVTHIDRLLSFDMGGTTAKGALILDGVPLKEYKFEAARAHDFKKGSGLTVHIPVIDMIEIGAGGGSIAALDERGLIRVGPRSAGARPGPACYGLGGEEPTLTDANLMLGYLDAASFLGGTMHIDPSKSEGALASRVGTPLDLTTLRSAWGVHELINEDVAKAFRTHASERGVDYRNCSMVAFGGSGPLHAIRIAQKLKIPRVILPPGAGVMSALGMLVSPLSFEAFRSHRVLLASLNGPAFDEAFRVLEEQACAVLVDAGIRRDQITIRRMLDARYVGQGHELELALPPGNASEDARTAVHRLYNQAYKDVFSIDFPEREIEIINWKVEATDGNMRGAASIRVMGFSASAPQIKDHRPIYLPDVHEMVTCPVYDRYALPVGCALVGPALIEERESTAVIGRDVRVTVDEHLNIVAEL